MEKKFEVSERNFTEDKPLHYLCSVMQWAKLIFMIKNILLKFFWFSIEKVWTMIFKNVWEPC